MDAAACGMVSASHGGRPPPPPPDSSGFSFRGGRETRRRCVTPPGRASTLLMEIPFETREGRFFFFAIKLLVQALSDAKLHRVDGKEHNPPPSLSAVFVPPSITTARWQDGWAVKLSNPPPVTFGFFHGAAGGGVDGRRPVTVAGSDSAQAKHSASDAALGAVTCLLYTSPSPRD